MTEGDPGLSHAHSGLAGTTTRRQYAGCLSALMRGEAATITATVERAGDPAANFRPTRKDRLPVPRFASTRIACSILTLN